MWLQEEVILLPCPSHPCFKRVNYDSSAWQSFGRGHLCINGRREVVAVRSVLVQCRGRFTSMKHGVCWGKLVCMGSYSIHSITHSVGVHLCAIKADNWGPRQNTWIAAAAAKQGNLQGGAPIATRWEQQVMPNNFSAPLSMCDILTFLNWGRRQRIFEFFAPPSICPALLYLGDAKKFLFACFFF